MERSLPSGWVWFLSRFDYWPPVTYVDSTFFGRAPPAGVVDTVRSFLASWVAVVKTRVEIISLEIEEQREWLEQLMLMAVAAGFLVSLGLVMLTIFIVVLFWETDARRLCSPLPRRRARFVPGLAGKD